jgi:DNA adenine methylase
VTNFFRVVKHRPSALAELLDHEVVHAERFRDLRHQEIPEEELHRALRFAYLVWYSFGAKGEHFASSNAKNRLDSKRAKMKRSLDCVRELLDQTAQRLRNVLIEQRSFEQILARYDSASTWFYLDPPYVHFQPNGRYVALAEDQRVQLFAQLADLKGDFLMSFDDCSEVRSLARRHRFHVRAVEVGYTLASSPKHRTKAGEVLISKRDLRLAA